jgi:hypothetical protein
MPRAHSGVLSRATLSRRAQATIALLLILAFAPAAASAEGPIARTARVVVATGGHELARPAAQRQVRSQSRRGPGRIIAGAAVGAVGGLFAGGYLGAAIDGECGGCDDPGLKGALIGMPIGAVAGGILGGKFLF